MRFKLAMIILAASCAPVAAQPFGPHSMPVQGGTAIVTGQAHVEKGALGTFIKIDRPGSLQIYGFVPFGGEHAFPELADLDGRRVAIAGVVAMDGKALITMTDPDQLAIAG